MKSDAVNELAGATWPVLLAEPTGAILSANPAAERAFGRALADGTANLAAIWLAENDASPAEYLARWERAQTGLPLKLLGEGGVPVTYLAWICAVAGGPAKSYLLQLLPAPTEAKAGAAESNLAHKQKLDCALQLARTVSLDFNNALTSILGHTSLILSKLEPGNPWRNSLVEVEKSAARAAEIANDLGAFSRRRRKPACKCRAISTICCSATWSCSSPQTRQGSNVVAAIGAPALLGPIRRGQDAAGPREDHGKRRGSPGSARPDHVADAEPGSDEPTQDRNAQLAAGAYVCAEITDDGCGIEAEVLPRIFEPFFTTKRASKHRGLGLAWVYGIVTNHGGGVAVSSQAGTGTSVRVYLPAEKKYRARTTWASTADLTGNQTILMVDDEDLLLTMGETILSAYGYKVLTANSGQKALDMITAERDAD